MSQEQAAALSDGHQAHPRWSQRRVAAEVGVRKYALRQLAPLHRSELGAGVEPAVTAFTVSRIETEGLSSLVSLVPSLPNELTARRRLTSRLSGERPPVACTRPPYEARARFGAEGCWRSG